MVWGTRGFVSKNHQNLREAAGELGLGLDSFYLDDSDFEREQMRQFNPEVAVLNDTGDALRMLESLLQTDVFDAHHISDEDHKRHREYSCARAQQSIRKRSRILKSLELQARWKKWGEVYVKARGANAGQDESIQRHHPAAFTGGSNRIVPLQAVCLALRLSKQVKACRIVGVLLAVPGPANDIAVDSFLISCRALGRGVEEILWAGIGIQRRRKHGQPGQRVKFTLLPIPAAARRIGLVAQLFDRLGVACVEETAAGKVSLIKTD